MTRKTELIISCHGNLKLKSVSKIFNCSKAYVSQVWKRHGCYIKD